MPGALARDQEEREKVLGKTELPSRGEGSTGQHPSGQEKNVDK